MVKKVGFGLVGLVALAFIAVFFVIPGPVISTASSTGAGMLFVEIDGRDAVIIAYDDDGASWRVPDHGNIAAFDLETGETIWDRGLDDADAFYTRLLAAGEEYAYLDTTFGFRVISIADGSPVASEQDIPGLGEYASRTMRFTFSPSQHAILFSADTDGVKAIKIDTLEAVDADATTEQTWICVLAQLGHGFADSEIEAVTVSRMHAGGQLLGFAAPSGRPPGTPTRQLVSLDEDGRERAVGDGGFVEPGFVAQSVLNEPVPRTCTSTGPSYDAFPDLRSTPQPLGTDAGYAVILHAQSARTQAEQITVVDATSGDVLGSNPAEHGLVDAATAPSGQAVVIVDRFLPGVLPPIGATPTAATVLIIAEDGSMQEIVLAPHGWFGLPW